MMTRLLLAGLLGGVLMVGAAFVGEVAPQADDGATLEVGHSVGECVADCEARRQENFQDCRAAGNPPNKCAHMANQMAKECKKRCKDHDHEEE